MPAVGGKKRASSGKPRRVATARRRSSKNGGASDTLLLLLALGCCTLFFVWVFGLNDNPTPTKLAPPIGTAPGTHRHNDPAQHGTPADTKEPTTFDLRILEMRLLEKTHAFGVRSMGDTPGGTASFGKINGIVTLHALQQKSGRRAELKGNVHMTAADTFYVDGVLKIAEYPEDTTAGYESRFVFKADEKRRAWVNNAPNSLEITF